MKKTIKLISIILIIVELTMILCNTNIVNANIKEGDKVLLQPDHECDSLVEFFTRYGTWSYKVVWYVYYIDAITGNRYPAFCVEPAKAGVGTGYESYDATIYREKDNGIWRILSKGYMGSKWTDWNLECDDDFYSATKIALHSYAERVAPNDKYILGNRSVDGNSVETIQRRGAKVLAVAQSLYEYGINGEETYQSPKVSLNQDGEFVVEEIEGVEYCIQNYKVSANRQLKSYNVSIDNFVQDTRILNSNNQEVSNLESNSFKIAIPIKNIKEHIQGKISIIDAQVKTCPVFYAESSIEGAQSYATYTSSYETTSTNMDLNIDPNTCSLKIIKVDNETKKPMANVEFEVLSEEGESLGKWVTDENGIIEINELKPGLIKVKEIKVDDKYILDQVEKEVELEWGKISTMEIGNNRKKGSIKIIKTDADNSKIKLQGVEFELYNEENKLVQKLITDENGEAKASNLDVGIYTIKEIKTNENYVLDEKEYTVKIEEDKETVVINITNKVQTKLPRTGF